MPGKCKEEYVLLNHKEYLFVFSYMRFNTTDQLMLFNLFNQKENNMWIKHFYLANQHNTSQSHLDSQESSNKCSTSCVTLGKTGSLPPASPHSAGSL